ncbi:MAG TPA: hypothetical protein VJ396_02065 [Acidiferrobacterales bacterium]|nr:hypothetical protein [Acidiferrobacterales bacterium]
MARNRRILILLIVLALVAGTTAWERLWVRGWARPLKVAIYPVAMDETSVAFVGQLKAGDFQEIGAFLAREAPRWRRGAIPAAQVMLKAPIRAAPPRAQPRGALEAIQWSLRLRWYAFRQTPFWSSLGTVRLFVLYHPLQFDQALPHSHGLQKGLLGVVHVFASDAQRAQNNFVIAHELLHTLGATDKYDVNGQPLYPTGVADPNSQPPYPQYKAEIMGGRVAITPNRAEIPKGLEEAVVGYATAAEIGW